MMRTIIKYLTVYGICWLLVINCGQTQSGTGTYKNTVSSGGHSYVKIDTIEGDTVTTPAVLPQVSGAHLTAPAVLLVGSEYYLWYSFEKADSITIEFTSSPLHTSFTRRDDSTEAINNGTVLWGTESWEGDFVEAPAVIFDGGMYKMWYEGGDSAGIGYATSSDGINWTKEALPVLTPGEAWEGGTVGNPTVIADPFGSAAQRYKMWYDGNSATDSGIGYATSPDGIQWTKRDASGRFDDQTTSSDDDNVVAQVLWPDPLDELTSLVDFDSGEVSAPFAMVYMASTGTITYKMWYAGETSDGDFNIGYAASPDGMSWKKNIYNPVVTEACLLDAVVPLGPLYELDPMVLYFRKDRIGDVYYMFFTQIGEVSPDIGLCMDTNSFLAIAMSPEPVK